MAGWGGVTGEASLREARSVEAWEARVGAAWYAYANITTGNGVGAGGRRTIPERTFGKIQLYEHAAALPVPGRLAADLEKYVVDTGAARSRTDQKESGSRWFGLSCSSSHDQEL